MKIRFVLYVAVGAVVVTAFGALADAHMARKHAGSDLMHAPY
ncbi:MAG: hypothetical protein AB8B62_02500 [Roseobacter sp.]